MARKLIEAGHDVRALARSQDKRAALAADGAHPVARVTEAVEGADAVLVCVFTDDQVQEACLSSGLLDAMSEGSTLVIHTTGSPRTAEDIADRAAPFGISVIDAPVSGGPHDIAAARFTLFAGGTAGTLDQVRPALASYADPILHALPHGSAASRALTGVTSRGSVAAFAAAVGGFLAKDVEVARDTAAVLGATLVPLDQAIALLTAACGSPHAAT
jgi:3-hydroxyisobutyrate dehydrogenase-like beta-hydroxyacid dehydrogenase